MTIFLLLPTTTIVLQVITAGSCDKHTFYIVVAYALRSFTDKSDNIDVPCMEQDYGE